MISKGRQVAAPARCWMCEVSIVFTKLRSERFIFWIALVASVIGGALWSQLDLPLGWLMGAALVTGAFAMSGARIAILKLPHRAGMIVIGSSVGLTLTPEIASRMVGWLPLMLAAGFLGMLAAALIAPLLARFGRMSVATAYFSLLPGGVIEMARIGEGYGADRTTIAALHAIRVALVVGVLPLVLLSLLPGEVGDSAAAPDALLPQLAIALIVGALGGWVGTRLGLPAAWLLGAVLAVGTVAATGSIGGRMPAPLLAAAQVIVGMALGARFERDRLAAIPRALAAGLPALALIITLMAGAATLVALLTGQSIASLVLAFSIGGMAEMVLTAKALHQDVALVAAFQALRGVVVNATAGSLWRFIDRRILKGQGDDENRQDK